MNNQQKALNMLNDRIAQLLAEPLAQVEYDLQSSFSSNIDVINELIGSFIKGGGKRIRPLFHILAASMCGYFGDHTRNIAVVLEYVHTASLLHDDVIDDASIRRGKPSANAIYGNNVTVLSGDYLYTSAFLNILKLPDKGYAAVLTKAVAAMSEGEILQLQKMGDLSLSMQEYEQIIYGKTAALFAAACECGAISGDQEPSLRENLRKYGCHAGYAFQMKDDLLDYFGTQAVIGKKPGTDLNEQKVTLPVILLLQELNGTKREAFEQLFTAEIDPDDKLQQILTAFKQHNIHDKASTIVKSQIDAATQQLHSFDDSPYKQALLALAEELNYRLA
jgi:octaprenyl-diphosphate synthase